MWLSCTAFFAQFYRCYSPIAFGKKWDPEGNYIRKYVPELEKMPKKYIYEPHKAPIQDQKKAGLSITGDGSDTSDGPTKLYPKPMFDFNERREVCMQRMKHAYSVGLYGNDAKVLDGTWNSSFDDDGGGPTRGKKGEPGGLETREDAEETEDVDLKSPRPGHKREPSQTTLDGNFQKRAK